MQTSKIKFASYGIALQEVPDEISLVFNLSGCRIRCKGCHSQYLWEDVGKPLLSNVESIVDSYDGFISCVCFMGGDSHIDELLYACYMVKALGLKTCIYSGLDDLGSFKELVETGVLDYIKIGHYDEKLGGLGTPTTNQRMYKINGGIYEDITKKFINKYVT